MTRDERRRVVRATTRPGWDDEGAEPIPRRAWARALCVARAARSALPRLAPPFYSPDADGLVHVTWTLPDGAEAHVEVSADGVSSCEVRSPDA